MKQSFFYSAICLLTNFVYILNFFSGHLYLQLMKEKMELWLTTLKQSIMKKAKSTTSPQSFELNPHLMEDCLRHTIHLERMFENFLGKFY